MTEPKKKLPPAAGSGRKKGQTNIIGRQLKDMILQALDNAGGVDYLVKQAAKNPKAFLALLGRVIPVQVTGEGGGSLVVTIKDYTGKKTDAAD